MLLIVNYDIKENNIARIAALVIYFFFFLFQSVSVVFGAVELRHLSPASQAQTG